jgi:hypothetical protein
MGCSSSTLNETQCILFDNRTKLCANILRLCLTIENFVHFIRQNKTNYDDRLELMIAADPQNLLQSGFFAILISQIDSKCYINSNLIGEIKQYIEFLPSGDCNIQTTLTQLSNCNEELWIQRDKLQDSLHRECRERK